MVAQIENSVCKKALWLLAERRRLGEHNRVFPASEPKVRINDATNIAPDRVSARVTEAHS